MGWNRENLRSELSKYLFELGSIEFQKKSWKGEGIIFAGDEVEVIESLIGCGISESLDEFVELGFLSNDESIELKKLAELLRGHTNLSKNETYDQLWNRREWLYLSKKSESIFKKHFKVDFFEYCNRKAIPLESIDSYIS